MSTDVLDVARALAHQNRAQLYVIHVVADPFHAMYAVETSGLDVPELLAEWTLAAEDRLARLVQRHPLEAGLITTAVLAGSVNKSMVSELAALGVRACGISGADAGTITAAVHPPVGGVDLGHVGAVTGGNPAVISALLDRDILPVVSSVATFILPPRPCQSTGGRRRSGLVGRHVSRGARLYRAGKVILR